MTTTDPAKSRFYLIAQLEAHYGRWLRTLVFGNYEACAPMEIAYQEREAEGNTKTMKMSEVMAYMQKCEQSAYDVALEGAQLINAAREIEDLDTLEILVKWQTLPNWKALMQKQGWEFDTSRMCWSHPEEGSTLSTS